MSQKNRLYFLKAQNMSLKRQIIIKLHYVSFIFCVLIICTRSDIRVMVSAFFKPYSIPSMLFLAFSSFLASGFLVASPIPGLRSGSNALTFFTPHLFGVIKSVTPIGVWCFSDWWLTKWIRGFGLLKLMGNLVWYMGRKIPAGMADLITPGEAAIRIAKQEWWSATRGRSEQQEKTPRH